MIGVPVEEPSPTARRRDELPVDIGLQGAILTFWWRLAGFVVNFLVATLLYASVLHMAKVISGTESVSYKTFIVFLWVLGLAGAGAIVGTWLNAYMDQIPTEVQIAIGMITLLGAAILAVPVLLTIGYVT